MVAAESFCEGGGARVVGIWHAAAWGQAWGVQGSPQTRWQGGALASKRARVFSLSIHCTLGERMSPCGLLKSLTALQFARAPFVPSQ